MEVLSFLWDFCILVCCGFSSLPFRAPLSPAPWFLISSGIPRCGPAWELSLPSLHCSRGNLPPLCPALRFCHGNLEAIFPPLWPKGGLDYRVGSHLSCLPLYPCPSNSAWHVANAQETFVRGPKPHQRVYTTCSPS